MTILTILITKKKACIQPQFVKGIKYITCSTLGWHDDLLQHFHLSENKLYMGCSFVFSCLPFFYFHINRIHKVILWTTVRFVSSKYFSQCCWYLVAEKKQRSFDKIHSLPHEFINVKVFLNIHGWNNQPNFCSLLNYLRLQK